MYLVLMQKRMMKVDPPEFDTSQAEIRRGWYVGSDGFRQELLERLNDRLRRSPSFSGEAVREHNEAESLIKRGLNALGMGREALADVLKHAN